MAKESIKLIANNKKARHDYFLEEKYDIENKLDDISKNIFNQTSYLSYNSKIDLAEASVGLGALVTFIALYLGIIFLISSAAILA